MNPIKITCAAILSLLLGVAAPAYAQQESQDEKQDHHQQQESKHEQAKPQQQHDPQQQQGHDQDKQQKHAQQEQRHDRKNQEEHAQQQQQHQRQQEHAQQQQGHDQQRHEEHAQEPQRHDRTNQEQHAQQRRNDHPQRTQEQQRVQHSAWQEHRSQRWDSDHRNWQQRGGYNGYRIPDDRYRGYFGRNHGFRIYGLPFVVVSGYPRFQYQGYWISLVDPWPDYWGNNWYDNDDVYVTYVDNGYYLYNRRYPNVGIAISISM
jgi:hypothetical protein